MRLSNNKSTFFVENSAPCEKACQRVFQIGQEFDQQAQANYFLSSKRNYEAMETTFNQDSNSTLSLSSGSNS